MKIIHEYRAHIIVLIIALLLRFFVFRISFVSGESMENTFFDKDILFCTIYDRKNVSRGDVLIIKSPDDKRLFIKRLIGMPKETISLEGENVLINGDVINEPYIKNKTHYYSNSIQLNENEYFVLGDNRDNSDDSRYFGPITDELIVARFRFKIF